MPDEIGPLGLTRNEKAGRRFDPRARGAGEGVGATGTGRDEGAAEIVGKLGVSLGGEGAALFVQARDVVELGPFPDRINEVHATTAREQEKVFEAMRTRKSTT